MEMNVGFIGLGMMGTPMAMRLLKGGYRLSVFNRTPVKAKNLVAEGARWCDSPTAVSEASGIVFSMVANPGALREIALGPHGVLQGFGENKIHIDSSTVSPALTRELAEHYRDRGCSFLHAPVLGSIPQATEGSLLLFVGGDEIAYGRSAPLLNLLGKRIWRFAHAEQASHMKLLCNSFIAGMITVLGQALIYARKSEVDPRTLLEILGQSQLNSPMYQTKGSSIIEGNFAPRFFLEHMLKDIDLVLDSAEELGVSLPVMQAAQQLFEQAHESGLGKEDYSAVVKVLSTYVRGRDQAS